jgi:hypothetical protein
VKTLTRAAAALALTLPLGLATAAPASAAAPGAECAQAGIATLKDLGLLQAAAAKQVDYSTLADPVAGPIFTSLPAGSNLSLGAVVKLHHTDPQLFAWCR